MKKKIISLLLAVVMVLPLVPVFELPVAAATSGTTGDCTWKVVGTKLTISGDGAMANYDYWDSYNAPWGHSITEVTIENGVTTIGSESFRYCNKLSSITIGNSVVSIGEHAFLYCSSLSSITIPDSVTTIESGAFSACTALTSIIIPDNVTTIGGWALQDCSALVSITIGNGVNSIGFGAFNECTSLKSIVIPNNVTSIGSQAFINCSSLSSVTIPNSVTSIGQSTFANCTSLKSITIPRSVTSIGEYAFSDCTSLASVSIIPRVISIRDYAFYNCSNLENVYYSGTQTNRNDLILNYTSGNTNLTSATWHYSYCATNTESLVHIYNNVGDTFCNICGYDRVFAGGDGTLEDPYLIETKSQLDKVRNYTKASFKLIANIEFSDDDFASNGSFYNSGNGWLPIGESSTKPFSGTFDGNGYSIINLQIFNGQYASTGLFGYNSGTIKNLAIANSHIANKSYPCYLGSIVGQNSYTGIVENCSSIGNKLISGTGNPAGGIVGYNQGIIRNCTNSSDITSSASARVGGICGSNDGSGNTYIGAIQHCFNSGKITLNSPSQSGARVGGIVGANGDEASVEYSYNVGDISVQAQSALVGGISGELYGTIKECYNSGDITVTTSGNLYVGGIAGVNENGIMKNSYNTASLSGKLTGYSGSVCVGGIAGENNSVYISSNCYTIGSFSGEGRSSTYVGYVCGYNSTNTIENCYYLGIADNGSGSGDSSTMYGNKLPALKNQTTYANFDFDNTWTMAGNSDYPFPELVSTPMVYERVIKSISIENVPSKLTYIQGYELLDITGGTLKIECEYDEHVIIPLSEASLAGFDNSIVGKQNISVSYAGYTTEFEVVVTAKGDVDGVEGVDLNDAIYLLYHVNFAGTYPVDQPADFDGSGTVDLNDAIYLLYHVNFPSSYPLH